MSFEFIAKDRREAQRFCTRGLNFYFATLAFFTLSNRTSENPGHWRFFGNKAVSSINCGPGFSSDNNGSPLAAFFLNLPECQMLTSG